MQITVYLDLVFFINFVANFIVLVVTCHLVKQDMKLIRMMLGAGLGAMVILPFVIRPRMLMGVKGMMLSMGTGLGTVLVALGKRGLIKKWCLSTTIMVLMGGVINFVKYKMLSTYMDIYTLLGLLFLSGTAVFILTDWTFRRKRILNNVCNVVLCPDGKNISEKMYLDTGNLLWDPLFDKPAILLSEEVVKKMLSKEEMLFVQEYMINKNFNPFNQLMLKTQRSVCFHEIGYESVGKASGRLLCFLLDEVVLTDSGKRLIKQPVAVADALLFDKKEYKGLLFFDDV